MMKKYTVLFLIVSLISIQFNSISALKCKKGFGISSKNSDPITYFYDNSDTDCGGTDATNPFSKPKGCFKTVHTLSDGSEYVKKGCLTENELVTGSENFGSKIFQYVCNADNCNHSNNLKFSFSFISTLLLISIFKFF
ncbi:unnamed protein product [Brachionus calyciflorus]|uniref:Uncharacterized protein n=1 Tax=Brachionus calyciflorus TaxID=104777 RepID=A0A813QZI1_9BILA|nr:unnamed protein product [Brachionus calyciflorus]